MNQIQSTAYFCVAHKQKMTFASFRESYEKTKRILIFYDTWKWCEIQMLASINKVMLEYICTRSRKCCLWAFSCYSDRTEYLWQRHMVPKAWNIYYPVLYWESLPTSVLDHALVNRLPLETQAWIYVVTQHEPGPWSLLWHLLSLQCLSWRNGICIINGTHSI